MSSLLQPRRTPEPERPFINRKPEIKLIIDKLKQGMLGKQMPSVVTCFWGAFGMGKSWLLIELERRCHELSASGKHNSHPPVVARLDLNKQIVPVLWLGDQLNKELLLRELWKQLAKQMGTGLPESERISAEALADAFVKQVSTWSAQSATPVIMLDTVDDLLELDEPAFGWLEEHLVEPLAMTDRVLFAFTSRGELWNWKRFQVRRRVDLWRLAAFDAKTAGKQLDLNPEIIHIFYRHAFGHPLFTEYLGTALENQGLSLRSAKEDDLTIEAALLEEILNQVVQEILKTVPEKLRTISQYTNVLRWVSSEPLRFLAEKLELVEPGRGDAFYLDSIIGELQAHHLLYWNGGKNCYEPDPVLRRLITSKLELDNPQYFFKAHQAGFEFHQKHLAEYPQYLARYIPELAYHRAVLERCSSLEEPAPAFANWLESFLKIAPRNPEPWEALAKALEQDHELAEVLSLEDRSLLISETRNQITKNTE
ncbi:MAG: hypothetical protein AB1894_26320 [Chloroflexota bacterium]